MNARALDQPSLEGLLETIAALKRVKQKNLTLAIISKAECEIKQLVDRLAVSNEHLSAANGDLETFSYSVAHDLRGPIRQIAGFSKILSEEYGAQLPAEAQRYLSKIGHGARKMGNLVDDLLHLAQIGRQALSYQDVALNGVVASAIESLQPDCADRNIEWRIEALSSAACDPGLMRQAFVNLLSNAVKYTRSRNPALIEIGKKTVNLEETLFVRDNGVGFDMRYANKLFGIFERLHPASEFEGTGVGLATVERIVRKHGGRIWAEAELNRGATFFFSLGACLKAR